MTFALLPTRWPSFAVLLTVATFCVATPVNAQENGTAQRRTVSVRTGPQQLAQASDTDNKVSPQERQQREQAAIQFAKEHHPALEKLLRQLRGMDPKEYGRAIREIYRVSERLSMLKERNPRSYETQLELWKANSNATLLAARLQLNPDNDQLRQQLREALTHKRALQLRFMQEELARTKLRVERLERNLERFEEDSQTAIDRQMRQLAAPTRPAKKSPANPSEGK
ncbi:hypothetical protein DTL42_12125 [Bremerella cremea]|uniref:Uncharacterized protein n=1 Tax=Bremerella cremea TaxID=1031537 RepID=A0A368KUH6_9BACT|nr:hypothetical protein [Bremerella cremea]RCS49277.1 hypothetical protein DTL42_12125 [Bremerella cremea]